MKSLKLKLMLVALILFIGIIAVQTSVNASNENIKIVKKDAENYFIYVKDNLNNNFEFAFSDNQSEDITNIEARLKDSEKDLNENSIAYINSSITETDYLWVKVDGSFVLEGVEVDLSKAISEYELQLASSFTKIINADLTKTNVKEEVVADKKITTITGKVILPEIENTYKYAIIKADSSEKSRELFNIATRISKFNQETDMYTQIEIYTEFVKLLNDVLPEDESDLWIDLEGNEIIQPEDSKDGEEYILYIEEINSRGSIVKGDVQFLTASRKEAEEKIIEKIETKLPVTYDNNILLIVFAIIIALIIVVSIRLKTLSKKEV